MSNKEHAHNRSFTKEDIEKLFEGKKQQLIDEASKWNKIQFVGKEGDRKEVTPILPFTLAGFYSYVYEKTGLLIEQYFTNQDGNYDDCIGICTHIKNYRNNNLQTGGLTQHYNANLTARLTDAVDRNQTELKGGLNIPNLPDIGNR